jgi:hypothetical protein
MSTMLGFSPAVAAGANRSAVNTGIRKGVISHDRWFLERIATHMLAFGGDGHVERFEGNCDDQEKATVCAWARTGTSRIGSSRCESALRDPDNQGGHAWTRRRSGQIPSMSAS